MRAVVQRVKSASVSTTDGATVGKIGHGLLVFLGVEEGDTTDDVEYIYEKTLNLRIFDDENGKMNLSVADVEGGILLVSQFTICGDARKGRRPSFIKAATPESAIELYEDVIERLGRRVPLESGVFGGEMQVELVNDGPVTMLLDSSRLF